MKRLAIDTNLLIPLLWRGDTGEPFFDEYDEIVLPTTVLGEFKAGLFPTKAGDRNRSALEVFLQKATVRVAPVTDRTADIYAKVYQALRKEGVPIPQNDMWIAASALEHGADLATRDDHFRRVPMLTVIVVD